MHSLSQVQWLVVVAKGHTVRGGRLLLSQPISASFIADQAWTIRLAMTGKQLDIVYICVSDCGSLTKGYKECRSEGEACVCRVR
jgi:hypothetical protein